MNKHVQQSMDDFCNQSSGRIIERQKAQIETAESIIRGLKADLAGQVRQTEALRRELSTLKSFVESQHKAATGETVAIKVAPDLEKRCFFALALGYFGRGASLDEALLNLLKAGCPRDNAIAVDLFIGDDKPSVINGGLNIEYNRTAIRFPIARYKSLGAALRNLREP